MRKYQILILIGSILVISTSSYFFFTGPVVTRSSQGWLETNRTLEMNMQQIPILVVYVIIPYTVATIIALTVKEYTKLIGMGLIILALYTWWAVYNITGYPILATIGFGLLLAAAILAVLYKSRLNVPA
jgi:hypothetical protein